MTIYTFNFLVAIACILVFGAPSLLFAQDQAMAIENRGATVSYKDDLKEDHRPIRSSKLLAPEQDLKLNDVTKPLINREGRSNTHEPDTLQVLIAESHNHALIRITQATALFNKAQANLAEALGLKKRAATILIQAKQLEESRGAIGEQVLLQNSQISLLIQRAFIHKIEKTNKIEPKKKTKSTTEDRIDNKFYETAENLDSILTSVFSGIGLASRNAKVTPSKQTAKNRPYELMVITETAVQLGKAQAEVARLWDLKAESAMMLTETNVIAGSKINAKDEILVNFLKRSVDTQSAISSKITASLDLATTDARASSASSRIEEGPKVVGVDTPIPTLQTGSIGDSTGGVSHASANVNARPADAGIAKSKKELEGDLLFSALQTVTNLTGGSGKDEASSRSVVQTWYAGLSAVVKASGLLGRAQADIAEALGLKQEAALMRAQAKSIEDSGDSLGGSQLEEFGQNSIDTQRAINDKIKNIVKLDAKQRGTLNKAGSKVMIAAGNTAIGVTTLVSASQAFASAPKQGVLGMIVDPKALQIVPKIPELLPEAISIVPKIFEVANEFQKLAVERKVAIAALPEVPDFSNSGFN